MARVRPASEAGLMQFAEAESLYNETKSRSGLINTGKEETARVRPASEAGLMQFAEAESPYMRPLLVNS